MNLSAVAKWRLTYRDSAIPGTPLWAVHTPRLAVFTQARQLKVEQQLQQQGWDALWSVTRSLPVVQRAAWLMAWQHKQIARVVVKRMRCRNPEDMFSGVGLPALYEAALDWDSERGTRFSTYAWRKVWAWVSKAVQRRVPYQLSDEAVNGQGLVMHQDMVFEHRDTVQYLLRHLDRHTRLIVLLHYGCGHKWTEIAERTGLAVETVRRWGARGFKELQAQVQEQEEQ